jgi:hypothetical protein
LFLLIQVKILIGKHRIAHPLHQFLIQMNFIVKQTYILFIVFLDFSEQLNHTGGKLNMKQFQFINIQVFIVFKQLMDHLTAQVYFIHGFLLKEHREQL